MLDWQTTPSKRIDQSEKALCDTAILLVNVGTPRAPRIIDVWRYLNEFLSDPRIIALPYVLRMLLVRGYIVPARLFAITRAYRKIWTDQGSPLLTHSQNLRRALVESFGARVPICLAMRYQRPSIAQALEELRPHLKKRLLVVPLFAQYASATSGSIFQEVMRCIQSWPVIPALSFAAPFSHHPAFLSAWAERVREYPLDQYDHVLFSFHGLPEKQVRQADRRGTCHFTSHCCAAREDPYCYRAACFETARGIAARIALPEERCLVAFQSRLGKEPWLQPYTAEVIQKIARQQGKRLLVVCPSFTADCLETLYEIGTEYAHEFLRLGGAKLDLVPCLNDHPTWVQALKTIICDDLGVVMPSSL